MKYLTIKYFEYFQIFQVYQIADAYLQESILSTFYTRIFQSQTLSREKLLKRRPYEKCACKMLTKLMPGLWKFKFNTVVGYISSTSWHRLKPWKMSGFFQGTPWLLLNSSWMMLLKIHLPFKKIDQTSMFCNPLVWIAFLNTSWKKFRHVWYSQNPT